MSWERQAHLMSPLTPTPTGSILTRPSRGTPRPLGPSPTVALGRWGRPPGARAWGARKPTGTPGSPGGGLYLFALLGNAQSLLTSRSNHCADFHPRTGAIQICVTKLPGAPLIKTFFPGNLMKI